MWIKYEEQMVKVKKYVAFDGKEYESKEDCARYEEKCMACASNYICDHSVKVTEGMDINFLNNLGDETCVYYVVDVDNNFMATCLKVVFLIQFCSDETKRDEWKQMIDNARQNESRVLVSLWGDVWTWHGTLSECRDAIVTKLERMFTPISDREEA